MHQDARMKTFVLFAIFFFGLSAFARLNSNEIVDRLDEDLGIHHAGKLRLLDLRKAIKTVRWIKIKHPPPSEITGTRQSAYYDVKKRIVYIYEKLDQNDPHRAEFELHEAMGALGMDDQKYTLSTALKLLSVTVDQELREQLLEEFEKFYFDKLTILAGGSGTSVGNGGDILALTVKDAVLDRILKQKKKLPLEFYVQFPSFPFEPFYDPQDQFVGLVYQQKNLLGMLATSQMLPGVPYTNGIQEVISIYFPALLWKQGGAIREQVLQEIVRKVLSLIPTTETPETMNVATSFCKEEHTLPFLKTDDERIQLIQVLRATAHFGCINEVFKETGLQMGSVEVKAPSW